MQYMFNQQNIDFCCLRILNMIFLLLNFAIINTLEKSDGRINSNEPYI